MDAYDRERAVFAVVMCHFDNKYSICETSIARLEAALDFAKLIKKDSLFVVIGDVPYEKGGETLEQMGQRYLMNRGVGKERIVFGGGFDTFSQARSTTEKIKSLHAAHQFFLFISDWYLWVCARVWSKRAEEQELRVDFIPIQGTGGPRTRKTYSIYGCLMDTCFMIGREALLEKIMTKRAEARKHGFTWDACYQ